MSTLNFDTSGPASRGSKKSLKIVVGMGALAAVLALGSTFASNIDLNGGNNVEFGQGVAAATACDDAITITPYSTLANEAGAGSHRLTSIMISDIDSRADKCSGKSFVIKAYGQSGQLDLFNWEILTLNETQDLVWQETSRYSYVEITNENGAYFWTSGGSDNDDVTNDEDVSDPARDLEKTSFILNLTSAASTVRRNPLASAEEVKRITVETKATPENQPITFCFDLGGTITSTECIVSEDVTLNKLISIPQGFTLELRNTCRLTLNSLIINQGSIRILGYLDVNNSNPSTSIDNYGQIIIRPEGTLNIQNGSIVRNFPGSFFVTETGGTVNGVPINI